jgi:membrane protein YqaA with SNARE-associated domain
MNLFLKGDRFLERISKTKYLHTVTFLVAFLEATISPLLPEAFLLLVLAYRKDVSWILLSITSAIGSSFGALTMYLLGKELYAGYGNKILTLLHGEAMASRASELFHNNAFIAQFLAALTPLPDRVFSFLAGVFLVSPFIVLLATK